MKLSNDTLAILENFSAINPTILVRRGKQLRTISSSKSVFAVADVEEEFEQQFAIFDLRKFIGCLSLFKEPELEFHDNYLDISEEDQQLSYYFADQESISTVAPEKTITLPSEDVKFTLKSKDFQKITKAMSVAGLSNIAVVGDGKNLMLKALDPEGKTNDAFTITLGSSKTKFKAVFRAENLKIINGDYDVVICSKGIASFTGEKVKYFIATEEKYSKF
jgi:hypothetical protein